MSKKDASNRIAIALIVDQNDCILMGKRNDNDRFTIPGGHLKTNEDAYAGLIRELKEETGLDAEDAKIAKVCKINGKILYLFCVKVNPAQAIDSSQDPDKECDSWFYMDPNEVRESLHVPVERNIALQYWVNS